MGYVSLSRFPADAPRLQDPTPRLLSAPRSNSLPVAGPISAGARVDTLGAEPATNRAVEAHPLVAIVGPTAAGKSALALLLAPALDGEILNYDSVQVYRGFNIGSGKLPPEARCGIPHHLLDCVDPSDLFTAGDFRREASRVLARVRGRGKIPILVGGTGLYLRALLWGLFEGPQRSEKLRARLSATAGRRGREFLHRLLRRLDPGSAARIQPRDTQKVIRAVEVCLLGRQRFSVMLASGREKLQGFRNFLVGLHPDRRRLYARIDRRAERMFTEGLIEEARSLLARPDAQNLKPLEALGYRQACAALRGDISLPEALRRTQAATRNYAKRQMTWFRREPGVTWFKGFGDDPEVQRAVLNWLRDAIRRDWGTPPSPSSANS